MHKIPISALLLPADTSLRACASSGNEHASNLSQAQERDAQEADAPPTPATINFGYFTRGPVQQMAQVHGFFADEKLTVNEMKTADSTLMFKNLRDGVWDIITAMADNAFQFRLNPGNPLGATIPVVLIARLDNGAGASLMTRPNIRTCADARGKSFAVDAPGSGYAYIGYQILRNKCGLEPNVDYRVITTGGTDRRYDDLIAGKANSNMVLIHTGLPERAEAQGMFRFGVLADAVSDYTAACLQATQGWLDAHPGVAVRFLKAMKRATDYVLDPTNKAEILTVLPADGNAATAERIYQMYMAKGGLIPNLGLDLEGLRSTAQLRQTWGGWDTTPDFDWLTSPASGVFDLSYWRRANLSNGEAANQD